MKPRAIPGRRSVLRRFASPARLSTLQSMGASGAGQVALVVSGIAAARILGARDRGQLALFTIIPLLLTVLGALGVPVATTYYIARAMFDGRAVVQTVCRLGVAQAVVLTGVYAAILRFVFGSATQEVQISAAATLGLIPGKLGFDYGIAILQGQRRFRMFNITRAAPNFFYASAVAVLFAVHTGHLLAVTLCYVVSVVFVGLGTLTVAMKGLPGAVAGGASPPLGEIVRFGLKAMLGAVYPTEAFQLDQAFVGAFLSRVELGTYVVGVSFSNLPRFLAQAVGLVAYPEAASISDPVQARRSVWRFFWFTVAVSLVTCGALEISTPWLVPLFFGETFRGSVPVTQLLLAGAFIASIRRVLADGLRGCGYPSLGTVAEVSALVVLLPTLFVLIRFDGLEGGALAMPIAASVGLTVLFLGAARTRPGKRGPPDT